ncbi:hypothetical protein BG005_008376 [Podila minutissima]|nr:hypothetical protein BG005_008376 [Podila minutissima]
MLGQLTPEQFNAIRYATDTLSVIVGVDVAYEDPYGLFTTVGHVDRALRALAQKDGEIIAKELDKTFVFQMCINAFDGIQSLAAYVSKFFNDPTLFRDLYNLRYTSTSAPLKIPDAATACKAAASQVQS